MARVSLRTSLSPCPALPIKVVLLGLGPRVPVQRGPKKPSDPPTGRLTLAREDGEM